MLLAAAWGLLAATTTESIDVKLGAKSVRTRLGETALMHVYLNNFSDSLLRGCSFTVQPDDEYLLNVGGLSPSDSAMAIRQGVIVSSRAIRFGIPRFSLDFSERPIGYGSFELLSIPVRPSYADKSYVNKRMYLTFEDNEVLTSGGTTFAVDTVRRWAAIYPAGLYSFRDFGNVDGIGDVTETDAMKLLDVIISGIKGPSIDFRADIASVDADPAITAFDGALILQYAYGILAELPVASGTVSGSSPAVRLTEPERISASAYRILVRGTGMQGLISVAAEFSLDTSVVTSVKEITTGVPGAKLQTRTDLTRATCRGMFIATDSLDTSDVDLFSLVVGVRAGVAVSQTLVNSVVVLVNDYDSLVAVAPRTGLRSPTGRDVRGAPRLTFAVRNGRVEASGPGAAGASIGIIDLAGRSVARSVPGGTALLPGASARYVVGTDGGAHARPALVTQSR